MFYKYDMLTFDEKDNSIRLIVSRAMYHVPSCLIMNIHYTRIFNVLLKKTIAHALLCKCKIK